LSFTRLEVGDSTDTYSSGSETSQSDLNNEEYAREKLLGEDYLHLDEDSLPWIANHIDCFVSQCLCNESVRKVTLFPHAFNGHGDDVWDRAGQAVGNLQSLKRLYIDNRDRYGVSFDDEDEDDDKDLPILDWEILARILRHERQSVTIVICRYKRLRTMEEVQPFALAIRGHSTITCIQDYAMFP
jgi:hypothetical protein